MVLRMTTTQSGEATALTAISLTTMLLFVVSPILVLAAIVYLSMRVSPRSRTVRTVRPETFRSEIRHQTAGESQAAPMGEHPTVNTESKSFAEGSSSPERPDSSADETPRTFSVVDGRASERRGRDRKKKDRKPTYLKRIK